MSSEDDEDSGGASVMVTVVAVLAFIVLLVLLRAFFISLKTYFRKGRAYNHHSEYWNHGRNFNYRNQAALRRRRLRRNILRHQSSARSSRTQSQTRSIPSISESLDTPSSRGLRQIDHSVACRRTSSSNYTVDFVVIPSSHLRHSRRHRSPYSREYHFRTTTQYYYYQRNLEQLRRQNEGERHELPPKYGEIEPPPSYETVMKSSHPNLSQDANNTAGNENNAGGNNVATAISIEDDADTRL